MEIPPTGHDPVLVREVLDTLNPTPGEIGVDCTLGRAGHAAILAKMLGASGLFIGMDVDIRNLDHARAVLATSPSPTRIFQANFAELDDVLAAAGIAAPPEGGVDIILADLGISTNQLFEEPYGMSFSQPMPLDMRLDQRIRQSAADIVNTYREDDLADVLYELAQERYSRRIARKIVEARKLSPIRSTDRLADIVRSAIPRRGGAPEKIDPATRTFLALRMLVNRELDNLRALLEAAPRWLKPGGRFAVISFQSMEDRLVKQAFRSAEQAGLVTILTKKPLSPSDDEIAANPRSRSAKLRAVVRAGTQDDATG